MPDDPAEEEDYFLPLEDQRVFGAGIRRKRVPFVRSSDPDLHTTDSALRRNAAPSTETTTGATIANRYLSIVLSKSATPTPAPEEPASDSTATLPTTNPPSARAASPQSHPAPPSTPTLPPPSPRQDQQDNKANPTSQICEICNLPLTASSEPASETPTPIGPNARPHEASLAHQLCLTHSHPPSHLDRTRPGLRYLAAYGWDPDSRLGLGAPGREGIRAPVKGKVKVDTVGLGVAGHNSDDEEAHQKRKRVKLNAKEVRRGQVDARKRGERLRELFYQDERILRYLGEG
ncbi:hypothetical protein BO82DRAFT_386637 [Aspergillus uvarum CBS 121591]|uniref:G-patch domain-containing protein n=1 Tax=Aspergillus uvarum CBS 121591 TaxID=1448315 RepID=A0A319BX89_9EURO|nr:hypothetical protein BO82DRAFT_386637 [Aspergillus uvarum CBS 121591]PYH77334.1 hypothetical protein BO82DRAFT_386637 [Aspergillus uvarum CBS 121591]